MKGVISVTEKLAAAVRYMLRGNCGVSRLGFLDLVAGSSFYSSAEQIRKEFRRIQSLRADVERPFVRLALSVDDKTKIDRDKWAAISRWILLEIGLDPKKHTHVVCRHSDADHDHIHALISRVSLSGRLWIGEFSAMRLIAATRRAEGVFGLSLTPGLIHSHRERLWRKSEHWTIHRAQERSLDRGEIQWDPDTLRRTIFDCKRGSSCMDEFYRQALGCGVEFERRNGQGLVVRVVGTSSWLSLSALTRRELSFPKLEDAFMAREVEYQQLERVDEDLDGGAERSPWANDAIDAAEDDQPDFDQSDWVDSQTLERDTDDGPSE